MYPSMISRNDLQIPSWWKIALGSLRRTRKDPVIYPWLQIRCPIRLRFITPQVLEVSSSFLIKKKKSLWEQGSRTHLEKQAPFFDNFSLKHTNGFRLFLSNQNLARALTSFPMAVTPACRNEDTYVLCYLATSETKKRQWARGHIDL